MYRGMKKTIEVWPFVKIAQVAGAFAVESRSNNLFLVNLLTIFLLFVP